ncbi:MAG TPA: transglutaminase family protein [Leptolyngbyaceae cyanobacterium]
MRYQIVHNTTYTYDRRVALSPHIIRLRSRCDGSQKLHSFSLKIDPEPLGISDLIDLDGNSLIKIWFEGNADQLKIEVTSEVETYRTNPFDYLLEPWALNLPIDYPTSLLSQLQPYLQSPYPPKLDPLVVELTQDICHKVHHQTTSFLSELNQQIYKNCPHIIRENGDPFPAGYTWKHKSGSCRDLTVLFMEACRAVGLAARFVSGYQEGDPDKKERELHAWAEVYLPGAGWRGYDPTHGLAVADRHIALVSSAIPKYTAPISGNFRAPGKQLSMEFHLSIESLVISH